MSDASLTCSRTVRLLQPKPLRRRRETWPLIILPRSLREHEPHALEQMAQQTTGASVRLAFAQAIKTTSTVNQVESAGKLARRPASSKYSRTRGLAAQ